MGGKTEYEELESLVVDLKAQIENERGERKQLEAVIAKSVSQILECQKESVENLKRHVEATVQRSVTNSVKQIEAFMGVQAFFDTGASALSFHGWPISSDIALFLIEKVMSEQYDLVVEFGSGTSTAIFARAIKIASSSSCAEVGNRVITFEHQKEYLEKTREALKAQGVLDVVDLVYAPLEEKTFDGSEYIYYSCEEKLGQIEKKLSGRKAKVLILVDGPPARTCRHARYPALPAILDSLSKHELHLVLDDYARKEEQEIVSSWVAIMSKKQIAHVVEGLPFEKGAAFIKVGC